MFRILFILAALGFGMSCTPAKPTATTTPPTQVMLLATIHNFHKTNPDYTYNDAYTIIRKYNPDIIGIEIRPEDIAQDTTYLKLVYPLEMRQLTTLFPKNKLEGFDWYGQEAAGKLLPADAFKGGNKELTNIKQLERGLNTDSLLKSHLEMISVLTTKMTELAKTNSASQLNNTGIYDLVAELFYKQMDMLTAGTPYATYARFNRQRDEHIGQNIEHIIRQHPGKKLIFVMGANHRFAARQHILKTFPEQVRLIPVPELHTSF